MEGCPTKVVLSGWNDSDSYQFLSALKFGSLHVFTRATVHGVYVLLACSPWMRLANKLCLAHVPLVGPVTTLALFICVQPSMPRMTHYKDSAPDAGGSSSFSGTSHLFALLIFLVDVALFSISFFVFLAGVEFCMLRGFSFPHRRLPTGAPLVPP